MPNALYNKGREGFLGGSFSWSGSTIQVDMIDGAGHTPNLATDEFRSVVATGARVTAFGGSLQTLSGKTITSGVADANDISFTNLASAASFEFIQVFADLGTDAQDRLICLFDTATGIPTPSGLTGTINVTWDNGANRIFML